MWASDAQVYTDYLRLEHEQIHQALKGIERSLQDDGHAPGNRLLALRLSQLRELLVRHFEQEDEGGCLEQAACCCPRLSAAVDRIAGEHKSLLRQLNELIALTQPEAEDASEFPQKLAAFSQRITAHDAAENMVLETAFGTTR